MSDDYTDSGHDSGYDGGHDSGYDAGHQQFDLDHLHAAQGAEHDQLTNFDQYNAEHADESDVHYANLHQVEAADGHGATFKETDATEYDAHEANFDSVNAESYTNAEHDSNFAELDHLREQLEAGYVHEGPELGESGHGELTAR